jgi:GT2 family glycosyltransferase
MRESINIAILMACHNRIQNTLECLHSLKQQSIISCVHNNVQYSFDLWLFDDASTDGTVEHVRRVWPTANIIHGDGKSYWCGAMRDIWKIAASTDPGYYLLMNDDTVILQNAVEQLISIAPTPEDKIIAVAPIADPRTGNVIFGGHIGHNNTPVHPLSIAEPCDTMNANCTLITRSVYRMLGGLHDVYTHSMGDFDYGFQATRLGVKIIQSPQVLGFSEKNPEDGSWRDVSLSRLERLHLLWFSPTKGLPLWEWWTYCRRNHGRLWFLKWMSPTWKIIITQTKPKNGIKPKKL